ncbi:PREDICTED: tyrosine-protein phosphatase 10D [Nicrophorus vespilloides]|uniref:protein-tyrosine-phosphatase n=1 Tax=Nicrophorus vespilloides TaxID=110193 RepID=A0ABM1NAT7_NICVS|nr:PREDICTED: tyrosine-protein phosphatase 10D [Nicrophorus vespilloides]
MSCSLPFRFICTCLAVLLFHIQIGKAAELVIHIPGNLNQDGVVYRLDYYPPFGHPEPNTTIASKDIHDVITFSKALPGTKYDFWLYYSNSTHNTLTWTANFTTVPDPPSNLSVIARNGKVAVISWSPPSQGSYSTFKLRINALSTSIEPKPQTIIVDDVETTLKDLTPGATYQVQAYTVFENKESAAYTSRNFTTKPNTPGKFIVWFRNETTLLVLWQPPYPPAIYSHYKVSIEPNDAIDSILYVEKEGEPPGPAQAAFKGLVPGRAYNISVQTMSEDEISTPTTAQYRTVPLRPLNITFDKASITSNSFVVRWDPPNGKCEFDKYQISLGPGRKHQGVTKLRDEQPMVKFKDLDPGKTYQVIVKIVSGKVTSWPMQAEVTLKPLPVTNLYADVDLNSNTVIISWTPNVNSNQSAYLVSYHEVESSTGDSNTITTNETKISLDALLPGRNYSIAVQAISKKTESNESFLYVVTRPSAPIIEDLRPLVDGLNISWKSDVNSRQDKYEVECVRNDTNDFILRTTYESRIVLTHLYPGAGYMVKVFAISHGRKSEPHEYFQPVFPRPPTNMTIEKTTTNSVIVQWHSPLDSLVTEYAIRYRTDSDRTWVRLPAVQNLEAEVTDMTPGERYTIQVNTVSYGLESNEPQQLNHTVRPNPVSNIAPLVDSNNVTLEWPRPEGRVEIYIVRWWEAVTNPVQINKRNVSQNNNNTTGPVRLLVGDLMPGVEYDFDIQAISNDLESDITPLKIRTMPLIQSEVVVVNNQISTDSISLRYTPTPQTSSKFDLYRFSLSETNIPDQEKDANDTDTLVKFTGLIPGRLYNITVWTVSQNVASQPLQRQDRLYPEPITGINSTHSSETEVTLSWALPRGEYNAFEVQYLTSENVLIQNLTLYNSITITDLKPHRNYTFTVIVRSGTESSILRRSLPFSSTFMTQESVPGKVDKFYPIDIQPSEITFNWSLPTSEHNGVIQRFTITYGLDGSSHTIIREFGADKFSGIIRQLEPGRKYVFKIQAETKVGYGPEAILFQKMPILAPPRPGPQVVPTEVCKSSTTIQIRFRKNYFSEQNGAVISYTIIVAEDDSKNSSGLEMPSWRDVQAYSVWPPFQIMEPYYPFQNSSVEDFTIGADSCDVRHTGYCNGPLKSGSTYKVKVRAFTAPDKFTDTSYSFPLQTDQNNTPIILGIVIPLVLILPIVIVVLVRRKRAQGRNATESRTDNMSLPDSVIETSRPIHIENFANHYRIMSADSDFRFSEEFEELKHVGSDQPCSFADLPCNRPKNRFTNILPYDHSRYKLQPVDDEEGSDYINANYVPGHSSPREFIVTQGPLHSTRDDFWRMCWESNSRAIIMLTRCVEKGREKCDHYWPYDTVPVYYGDISVQILNESRYPDWNISEFMVCRGDIQRVIRHFHFTSWPDFGVPNPPHTLVRFVRAFREKVGSDQRPIVVHCSAGVGRSGTFICLDRILQQIRNYDYVDIFGIVYAMRKERVWMVQTEQQYICIYQCLLVVLEGKEVTGPPREIHENQGFEDDEGIAESGM